VSLAVELQELLAPAAWPHPVAGLQVVETPISWVLLTGRYAYKIKRPVRLEYLDQRTLQRRAQLCAEELRLNQRFAPELYLGVRAIRRDADRLRVDGDAPGGGTAFEYAVCMRQFERSQELDRLVAGAAVSADELAVFGRELAALQAGLAPALPDAPWGSAERVRELVLANLEQCRHAAAAFDTAAQVEALRAPLERVLERSAALLGARRAAGHIRECHGDLHARNIVRLDGRLRAFDCVEFEPAFRWIDVADDVAFLVADLETLGAPRLALAFLQGWLEASGDWQACRLLPLYQAHRALVRAKVAALSSDARASESPSLRRAHLAYLAHAAGVLGARRPCLLLMSGLSGSGKTWLAARLAPELGALHLRSDIERKRAAGLAPLQASGSAPGRALYAPEATAAVYRALRAQASDILDGGRSVIVDATFLQATERAGWRALAAAQAVPFGVIHCEAPPALLRSRISARRAAGADASEADLAVLEWQLERAEPAGPEERSTLIEADTSRADVLDAVLRALRSRHQDVQARTRPGAENS
jgi:aminoglycoside phosphotransferase family enzyme/predicted kinase